MCMRVPLLGRALSWATKADKREERTRRDLSGQLERQVRSGKRIVIRDPLTTLLHRWYFELRVGEEVSRCQRYAMSMSLLHIRVGNHSKRPTAHPYGEMELVQTFTKKLRSIDLMTKLGESEYAVCLPQTPGVGAKAVARRLMQGMNRDSLVIRLAICPKDGSEFDDLLASARVYKIAEGQRTVEMVKEQSSPIDLAERVAKETSGRLQIEIGETARSLKLKLRRASRKAGVDLKIWEKDGFVLFERTDAKAPATDVA